MPSPRQKLRQRSGWTDAEKLQCACSHDWFGEAWGRLDQLTPAERQTALEEMQACYRDHKAEIDAMATTGPAWITTINQQHPATAAQP